MLVLSIVSAAVFAGVAVWMYFGAHFASTRQMALLPLLACGVELLTVGLFSSAFAVVTALLCVLRVALVLCCLGEMNRDAIRHRRRQNRRATLSRQMMYTDPICAVPSASSRVTTGQVA